MNLDFLKDALLKFSNENLLATILLCIVLAMLTALMFGKSGSEKLRFSAFVLVIVFFSSALLSVNDALGLFGVTKTRSSPTKEHETQVLVQNEILISAADFTNPLNVALGPFPNLYGADVLMNAPPHNKAANAANFEFDANLGNYTLFIRLAAAEPRPLNIAVNGKIAMRNVINASTGGWMPQNQQWLSAGTVRLNSGKNVIRISRHNDVFPHITKLKLSPTL